MWTPSQKGAIAETAIAHEAAVLGITVLKPLTEGGRYDLVLDVGGRFLRAQCKWARLKDDVVVVICGTRRLTPSGWVRTTYASDEIDGIAAYCLQTRSAYWLPVEKFGGRTYAHLRLKPARNNQQRLVHFAADYSFGAIAQLGERLHGMQEVAGSSPASSTPAKPLF